MAWRQLDRLVELSRGHYSEDERDDETLDEAKGAIIDSLPEDETSAAIRSRQVFEAMAKSPLTADSDDVKGVAKLSLPQMEEAMNRYALNCRSCNRTQKIHVSPPHWIFSLFFCQC